jgi:Uma2 family endonuclease
MSRRNERLARGTGSAVAFLVIGRHGNLERMAFDRSVPVPPRGDELPYSDGEEMESKRHVRQYTLLVETLDDAWAARDDYFCAGNMFVYYSALQAKRKDFRGPDVFVVTDVPRRERKSWVAWEEDGRLPDVCIEITSETTEAVDRGEKMRIYGRVWHTAEYFLFDPFAGTLEGYELDAVSGDYVRKMPREDGDLDVRKLGLRLGVRPGRFGEMGGDWLRWIDAHGRVLETGAERAKHEAARADQEKARAEKEKARADQEKARAEKEKARAEKEKARADELEARLAALARSEKQ